MHCLGDLKNLSNRYLGFGEHVCCALLVVYLLALIHFVCIEGIITIGTMTTAVVEYPYQSVSFVTWYFTSAIFAASSICAINFSDVQ